MEDYEDAGQRYMYLLRPVKDLQKNFEIDIAKELDEYCERLGSVVLERAENVDNEHRFNFAEAAMLIQGSAFVFGRKVDLVHSQVIHFFDSLQPQKSKRKKKKGEDDDEGFVDGEATSIDPCDLQDYSSVKMCSEDSLLRELGKTKYRGQPPKIKVMPMSLVPLAEHEKSGVPIYSDCRRMEIIGDMDDFRMNSGFVNARGVLLMNLGYNKLVDDFASEDFLRLWYPHLFNAEGKRIAEPYPGIHAIYSSQSQRASSQQSQSQPRDSGICCQTDDFGGGDAGRVSSAMEVARRGTANTFNDLDSARPSTHLTQTPEVQSMKVALEAAGDGAGFDSFDDGCNCDDPTLPVPPARRRSSRLKTHQLMPWETTEDAVEEDCTDALLLDPFAPTKWKSKPIEKITRFVKGTVIATRMEKAEKANMTFQKRTMKTNDYVKEHFYMRKKQKTFKGDDWQSDALYRFIVAVMKKRAEAKRQRKKAKISPSAEAVYNEEDDENYEFNDDDDYDDVDVEQENIENIPPPKDAIVEPITAKPEDVPEKADRTLSKRKPSAVELLFGDIEDDELNTSISINSLYGGCTPVDAIQERYHLDKTKISILELLHAHMLKFWSTAEEATSELVARVQEWEDTMLPILEEEETRKDFDIHEYGDELLNMFHEVGETKTLGELLHGRKKYEVSRYFLACLMMANTYNVNVDYDFENGRGCNPNMMKVTLLKRDRHHEVFDKAGAL